MHKFYGNLCFIAFPMTQKCVYTAEFKNANSYQGFLSGIETEKLIKLFSKTLQLIPFNFNLLHNTFLTCKNFSLHTTVFRKSSNHGQQKSYVDGISCGDLQMNCVLIRLSLVLELQLKYIYCERRHFVQNYEQISYNTFYL